MRRRLSDDADPLLPVGLAIVGAGAALTTVLGPVMYFVIIGGLVVLALGTQRTRTRTRQDH